MHPSDSTAKELKLIILVKEDDSAGVIALYNELIADDQENIAYPSRLLTYLREEGRGDEVYALLRDLLWLNESVHRYEVNFP